MHGSRPKHRHTPPQPPPRRLLTVEFGDERLTLQLGELSPETLEWIAYDTRRLTARMVKAAERAREFVDALGLAKGKSNV